MVSPAVSFPSLNLLRPTICRRCIQSSMMKPFEMFPDLMNLLMDILGQNGVRPLPLE